MSTDPGPDPWEGRAIAAIAVRVERDARGRWLVALPDRDRIVCETLDDARREGYVSAVRARPCELIVHDAYHRLLSRELVTREPGHAN
jgi:hypothetical protein